MNIKEIFLQLTEFTTPYQTEFELEPLLPKSLKKDEWGNYYIQIGSSETFFTCHLDNYCKTKEKINQSNRR
jgi:hypothetical protein